MAIPSLVRERGRLNRGVESVLLGTVHLPLHWNVKGVRLKFMQIGELANRTAVSTKTIRYYEGIGILPEPDRAPNGYREYSEDIVGRLQFVRDAQASGLTLTEIASILDLRSQGVGTCHHVVSLIERHVEDLDKHIENLHRTRTHLAALTERAKNLDPAQCTDPNRCQTIETGVETGERSGARATHLHAAPHRHAHD